MRSFKSLDYSSIMSMALVKGMVTLSCLIKSISFLYRCSLSYFVGLRGYNFSHVIACLASRVSWLFVLIGARAISSTIMSSFYMSSFTSSSTFMSFLTGSLVANLLLFVTALQSTLLEISFICIANSFTWSFNKFNTSMVSRVWSRTWC